MVGTLHHSSLDHTSIVPLLGQLMYHNIDASLIIFPPSTLFPAKMHSLEPGEHGGPMLDLILANLGFELNLGLSEGFPDRGNVC